MSVKNVGRHLTTLDLTSTTIIQPGESILTISAIVRNFNVIISTLTSDVDLTVEWLWSVDGFNYAIDSSDTIDHAGDPLPSFYERSIKGIALRYRITNNSLVASTVLEMTSYARTGGFGIDAIEELINEAILQDVYWTRTDGDPNEITELEGNRRNICTCDNVNLLNIPDPAQDLIQGTTLLATQNITLDWNGTFAGGSGPGSATRDTAFKSIIINGSNGTRLVGPGQRNALISGGNSITVTNTSPAGAIGPGQHPFALNYTILNGLGLDVWNPQRSLIHAAQDVELHFAVSPTPNQTGQDSVFVHDVYDESYISDVVPGTPGEVGCLTTHSAFLRLWRSRIRMDSVVGCQITGTRVLLDGTLGNANAQGICVFTDHSNPSDNNELNWLQIGLPTVVPPGAPGDATNSWHSRFSGGYNFWTDANSTIGARLGASAIAFSVISDKRLKQDLHEYHDTKGVLDRVATCPIVTYKFTSLLEEEREQEEARFRIGPTAQDFHTVFHPEDGTCDELVEAQNAEGVALYQKLRKEVLLKEEKNLEEEDIDAMIAMELITPEVQRKIVKMTQQYLHQEEVNAALMICVKELKKQVDALSARITLLEG